MNGSNFLLDTNAITALLQGNSLVVELLKKADWVGISIISQIEFSANPGLSENDRVVFDLFLKRVHVVNLVQEDSRLIKLIQEVRTRYRLKLPDAIIAASAIRNKAVLLTADQGIKNIKGLKILTF